MEQCVRDTHDFLQKNEIFFPLGTVVSHFKLAIELFNLFQEAKDIARDLTRNEKQRAFDCILLFHKYDIESFLKLRREIVDQYRSLIGVADFKNFDVISKINNGINN